MKKTVALILALTVAAASHCASRLERLSELNRRGQFAPLVEEAGRMKSEQPGLTLGERLTVDRYLTTGLMGCRRYRECLATLNSIIETDKPDSLRYHDLHAYIGMNDIFCALGSRELARTALAKAEETLAIIRRSNPGEVYRKNYVTLHMAKAVLAQSEGNITEALREWRMLEDSHSGSASAEIAWLGLGGTLYQDSGNEKLAAEYFARALAVPAYSPNKMAVLLRYAAIDIENGDYAAALDKLRRYHDRSFSADNAAMRTMLLQAEGDALYGMGRWREAAEHFGEAILLNDSISRADGRLMDALMAERISPEDYSALNRRVEGAEQRTQRVLIISLGCLVALLGLLCVILYKKVLAQRLAQRMMEQAERSEQGRATAEGELSLNRKELCSVSLAAAQTESVLVAIRTEVKRESTTVEERLRSIESALRGAQGAESLQENFRTQFDETNQALYTRLTLLHPGLTKTELNMAAYLLLNLNSKEIAQMTNRSVRTVDNIKYNLRKKLAIDEPTPVYLRRLMSQT